MIKGCFGELHVTLNDEGLDVTICKPDTEYKVISYNWDEAFLEYNYIIKVGDETQTVHNKCIKDFILKEYSDD